MKLPPILILAGGLGSRVAHISGDYPKSMIKIGEKYFIEHQIKLFNNAGFKDIIFSVGYKEKIIKDFIQQDKFQNINIRAISDGSTPLGTGGAVINALSEVKNEFFVTYGDSFLDIDFKSFYLHSQKYECCMVTYQNHNKYDRSNCKYLKNGTLIYDKKAHDSDFDSIDCGMLYFKKSAFNNLNFPESFDLADLLAFKSKEGKLQGFEIHKRFFEIGSESGIQDLTKYLKEFESHE